MNKTISIIGRDVLLAAMRTDELNKLSLGDKLLYNFYTGAYKGVSMIFVEPKEKNPTPRNCQLLITRLKKLLEKNIVLILQPTPTYERQRLIDKDVYFVMSDRYANLPMLVAVEHTTNRKSATELTPVAQYILLYHLEVRSLNGLTAKEIAEFMPYSYESVTLGLTCLSDLNLCKKEKSGQRGKSIRFVHSGKELWEKAQDLLFNPVERTVYCDNVNSDAKFPVCGINALSHYTFLNPDPEKWIALTSKEYKALLKQNKLVHRNEFDGNYILEIWKYPPISHINNIGWVDKLSLALSLRDNDDPRVEKEVERMIQEIQWTD